MNRIRTPLIRAALATAMAGGALLLPPLPHADDAVDLASMSVDAGTPLQATLLPTVTVVVDANHPDAAAVMHVAAVAARRLTLLPTVHVAAPRSPLAMSGAPADALAATDPACRADALDARLAAADPSLFTLVSGESLVSRLRLMASVQVPR